MTTLCRPCPFASTAPSDDAAPTPTAAVTEIAGVIIEVYVRSGDTVAEGEPIALLDSMKMEIPVLSTVGGTVRHVTAGIGDFLPVGGCVAILA